MLEKWNFIFSALTCKLIFYVIKNRDCNFTKNKYFSRKNRFWMNQMSWQKAIILNPNEQVLHSWSGNCERHYKTVVPKKGLIRTKYVSRETKEQHSGELVLTNKRLLWLERRGMLSKTYRASFEIDLLSLQGITVVD
jgi:hypothetical protein